jgi:hypothetical protein
LRRENGLRSLRFDSCFFVAEMKIVGSLEVRLQLEMSHSSNVVDPEYVMQSNYSTQSFILPRFDCESLFHTICAWRILHLIRI